MNVLTAGGRRLYQRRVNLCPTCADRQRGRNVIINLLILVAVAALVLAVVLANPT